MFKKEDQYLLIERFARGKESQLIEKYIQDGPTAVQDELELTDTEWQVIFDYLVFEHNLLYKCVSHSSEFFHDCYVKFGVAHVRSIIEVEDKKYDKIFEVIFDYLAISLEGLNYHVMQNREKYVMAFKVRGGDYIRTVLALSKEKYQDQWMQILDVLLKLVCDDMFTEQNCEHSLNAFVHLFNINREHRIITKKS
ncbi:MAG: hypothetical protein AAB373_03790 [Patescibacteria group bacterium]